MSTHAASQTRSLPISVRNLTKTYGAQHALDNVSIDIRAGEFLTLLGPSGSGKTTLLMALAGFVNPDAGSIRFGDQEVATLSPHKRGLGMVFQSYALFPLMSVAENVAYPLKIRGLRKADIAAKVADALAMVQLDGYGERRIQQMSGGQRQRVALARAMVFEPRIILMDEPASALDPASTDRIENLIGELCANYTIVIVTHNMQQASRVSHQTAFFYKGKLIESGPTMKIFTHPSEKKTEDYITGRFG